MSSDDSGKKGNVIDSESRMTKFGKRAGEWTYHHASNTIGNFYQEGSFWIVFVLGLMIFFVDWTSNFYRGGLYDWRMAAPYLVLAVITWYFLHNHEDAEGHEALWFVTKMSVFSYIIPLALSKWITPLLFGELPAAVGGVRFLHLFTSKWAPLVLMYLGWPRYLFNQAGKRTKFFAWINPTIVIVLLLAVLAPMFSAFAQTGGGVGASFDDVPGFKEMAVSSFELLKTTASDFYVTARNETSQRLDAVTQTRYTGQVERQQGKPLGVFIRDQNALRTAYRYQVEGQGDDATVVNDFNEDITWFGTLRARTLLDRFDVGLSCRYDWAEGNVTDACACRPDNVTIHYTGDFTDEYPFECSVSMEDIPYGEPRGLYGKFYTVAEYEFDTWGYTTYAFMDRDTMTALRREGKNPAREIGVSQRATARYTPGPVSLGMEAVQQPIGVYPDDPDRNFLPQFGITVENAWRGRGEVTRIDYLVLQVPHPIELDTTDCAGLPDGKRPRVLLPGDRFRPSRHGVPQKDAEVVPEGYRWYEFTDIAFAEDQAFKTVRCPTVIADDASWGDLLGPDLSPKLFTFVARTHYDYVTKMPAPARVTVERIS